MAEFAERLFLFQVDEEENDEQEIFFTVKAGKEDIFWEDHFNERFADHTLLATHDVKFKDCHIHMIPSLGANRFLVQSPSAEECVHFYQVTFLDETFLPLQKNTVKFFTCHKGIFDEEPIAFDIDIPSDTAWIEFHNGQYTDCSNEDQCFSMFMYEGNFVRSAGVPFLDSDLARSNRDWTFDTFDGEWTEKSHTVRKWHDGYGDYYERQKAELGLPDGKTLARFFFERIAQKNE